MDGCVQCENVSLGCLRRKQSSIAFPDGTPVPRKRNTSYLGTMLNDEAGNKKEKSAAAQTATTHVGA